MALYLIKWPHNATTAAEMNVKKLHPGVKDFSLEKEMLLQRLKEVEAAYEFYPHPRFGKIRKHLWGRLIWKHIDHHLRQFGG